LIQPLMVFGVPTPPDGVAGGFFSGRFREKMLLA
jgi:hypothetical protein